MPTQSPHSCTLERLTELAGGRLVGETTAGATEISAIGLDSSQLPADAIFAALPGTKTHGAHYASQGKAAAALAVLSDHEGTQILVDSGEKRPIIEVDDVRRVLGILSAEIYGHPSHEMTIIGVTGTSGKTTTSYILERGLMAAGLHVGLIGTTGTRINGRKVPTKLTTPEAPTLQQLFSQMKAEGVSHVVMEVSSHALALGRVTGTRFSAAGFTNLSQDHLDFHPTMQEYFEAKALFFDPASPIHAEKSVVCVNDLWGKNMAERAGADAITVCTEQEAAVHQADYWVSNIDVNPVGAQSFIVHHGAQSTDVHLPLPGGFNIANTVVALALAESVGVDKDAFIRGIADVAVPGRMERIVRGQEFLAVVDYAHKPAAVAAVIDTVRDQVPGRIAVVVGAGGDRDSSKRPIMGAEAARRADLVIVTDDNPRSEDPAKIREAVLEGAHGVAGSADIREIGDRREAIRTAVQWAQPGDAVIVAGKGHEVGQLINGVDHHFDDREEVAAALHDQGFDLD